jgi:serine/threonine-protein kinase
VREHGSVTEQLLGAMTRPVPSLGDVTALPRSVVAVVDRALAFDREDRFPDARSMQLAVRAVLDELSAPDSRASVPPPSVEPMALSLRTPRPEGRNKRPSIPTVRPVSASMTPLPSAQHQSKSALPIYVTLGFALGIGIVVAARFTVRTPQPAAAAEPQRVSSVARPLELASVAAPSSAAALSASASSRARQSSPRAPLPVSDPLSRRK